MYASNRLPCHNFLTWCHHHQFRWIAGHHHHVGQPFTDVYRTISFPSFLLERLHRRSCSCWIKKKSHGVSWMIGLEDNWYDERYRSNKIATEFQIVRKKKFMMFTVHVEGDVLSSDFSPTVCPSDEHTYVVSTVSIYVVCDTIPWHTYVNHDEIGCCNLDISVQHIIERL